MGMRGRIYKVRVKREFESTAMPGSKVSEEGARRLVGSYTHQARLWTPVPHLV